MRSCFAIQSLAQLHLQKDAVKDVVRPIVRSGVLFRIQTVTLILVLDQGLGMDEFAVMFSRRTGRMKLTRLIPRQ